MIALESPQIEYIIEEEFQLLPSDSASKLEKLLDSTIAEESIEKFDLVTFTKVES